MKKRFEECGRMLAAIAAVVVCGALHAAGTNPPASTAKTTRESSAIAKLDSRTKDPKRDPGIFGDYWWANRFLSRHVEIEKLKGRKVDLVLLGDSIMHFWQWKHPASWAKLTKGRTVLNLGYGGDCTHNVIWRVEHGELDGYDAKCVVLMIGTNNNSSKHTKPCCCSWPRLFSISDPFPAGAGQKVRRSPSKNRK